MAVQAERVLRPAWSGMFMAIMGVATIGYFNLASGAQTILYPVIALSAAAAMFAGIAISRPELRSAWLLLPSSVVLFAIGDILFGVSQPVPSPSDMFYVSAYPIFGLGLAGLARSARTISQRATILEAAIIALAVGIVAMVLLLVPSADTGDFSLLTRVVSLGYPVMDLALLGALTRASRTDPARRIPFLLLGIGLALLLVADTGYALLDFGTAYAAGIPLDGAWLLAYTFLGAALLHPAMAQQGFKRFGGKISPPPPPAAGEARRKPVIEMNQSLRFGMLLKFVARMLLGLMACALFFAFSWQAPNLVLLAGAYGGMGTVILVAGALRSY